MNDITKWQFGWLGGRKADPRLIPEPLPHEINTRARAQSLLTRNGQVARLPSYNAAKAIIARSSPTPK